MRPGRQRHEPLQVRAHAHLRRGARDGRFRPLGAARRGLALRLPEPARGEPDQDRGPGVRTRR